MGEKGVETATGGSAMPAGGSTGAQGQYPGVTGGTAQPMGSSSSNLGAVSNDDAARIKYEFSPGTEVPTDQSIIGPESLDLPTT